MLEYSNSKTTSRLIQLLIQSSFLLGAIPAGYGQYIDGGNQHTVILTKEKEVWTMGKNEYGELGDSTLIRRIYPVKVNGLPPVVFVSRGYKHTLAVDENGHVWTWGWNNYGQLGAALPIDYHYPQMVKGVKNAVAVEGGHWHSLALLADGSVMSWGHNFYGELGNGNREHTEIPTYVFCSAQQKVSVEFYVKPHFVLEVLPTQKEAPDSNLVKDYSQRKICIN